MFKLIFFQPLYNALVWLTDILPGGDIGLAVILLTLIVRFVLFPLQHRMTHTQHKLKSLEGQIKEIKEKHSKSPQDQAKATMALYKEHGISPFSGFLLLLIQIPILWALYRVFSGGLVVDPEMLYSFVEVPTVTNSLFLGLVDLSTRSWVLAILAGAAQFGQIHFAMPPIPKREASAAPDMKADLMRSMNLQMRFVFPIMIVVFSLSLPSVMALYWITTSLFSIVHEIYVKKRLKTLSPVTSATN